jgi:hypothetical protein
VGFPLSWSADVLVPGAPNTVPDPIALAVAIEAALREQRPRSLSRTGTAVQFRAGILRWVSNTNVLVPISSGDVEVHSELSNLRVSYTIRFTEILLFALVATAVFAFVIYLKGRDAPPLFKLVATTVPLWWIFGGNVTLAVFRFPRMLKRAADLTLPSNNRWRGP